jgi:hypothetical protein
VTSDFSFFVGFRAVVHWCPADYAHWLHVIAGARRGPGWYVFVQNGCRGRVAGPFESEASAYYAARTMERATRANTA